MEFLLLGPLEVREDGAALPLGGSKQRALLALLLLHRNEMMPVERLVDELWGEAPPRTAAQTVRVYVSQLRKTLGQDAVATQGSAYVLRTGLDQVDVDRFEALVAEGRRRAAAGDRAALEAFDDALALWRGPPLPELAYEPFADREIARLEELRLGALEDRFDALLAAGKHVELVPELAALVAEHPLRERLRAQLMLALYRSGRQSEALDVYADARRRLVDELGIEPGEQLRELQARMLRQDRALRAAGPASTAAIAEPPGRPRPRVPAAVLAATVGVAVLAAVAAALLVTRSHGGAAAHTARVAFVLQLSVGAAERSPLLVQPLKGLRRAERELGVRGTVVGSPDSGEFLTLLKGEARRSDLVIVGPALAVREAARLARSFPKTRFVLLDSRARSAVADPPANLTGVAFADREVAFLAGFLGALSARAPAAGVPTVSAVGGFPIPAVRTLVQGFRAGATRARPGVRVLVDYANSFVEQAPCERAANRQIDAGSTVVFDVAGDCGLGALQAAGIRGVWGVGVDYDLSYLGPHILASAVKRFDNAVGLVVQLYVDGHLPQGRDVRLDLANDGVGLVGISDRVPQSVRARLERVAAELRARHSADG